MRILRHFTKVAAESKGAVVAIGNFDGIHRGHQEVIAKTRRLARELEAPSAVMTFEPHPRAYFAPDQPPFRLTPFRVKTRLIEALGVDILYVLRFDRSLANLEAEDFITRVLGQGLSARHVIVGDNFHFGRKRRGTPEMLETLARAQGIGVTVMKRVAGPGSEPYSSTLVREYLKTGNPTRAALLLGRYWEIEGRIQHGAKRGRDLGFPTANISLGQILRPAFGVYAVRATVDTGGETVWLPGVANIGISPMFSYDTPLLEVHLLDFNADLYGKHMRVALIDYLRPEISFPDLEALKERMVEDRERASAILAFESWEETWPTSPFITAPQDRE